MKKLQLLTLILFVSGFTAKHVLGQGYNPIETPFYEPFEDSTFYHNGFKLSGVAQEEPGGAIDGSCDNDTINNVVAAYGYSWKINANHQSITCGKALKLKVHEHDHPQMELDSNCHGSNGKSRAETVLHVGNEDQSTVYYSWRMFIPIDDPTDSFVDDFVDEGNAGHTMAQFKTESFDSAGTQLAINSRKVLGMVYKHDTTASNNQRRRLKFLMYNGGTPDPLFYAKASLDSAIRKGEWNQFVLKMFWSSDTNNLGTMDIWINRYPVVKVDSTVFTEETDTNYTRYKYSCDTASMGTPTSSFEFPNIGRDTVTNSPVYNIMRLGNYRPSGYLLDHSVYIDDYRVTDEMPPDVDKTKVLGKFCGITLPVEDMTIECYELSDVETYRFKFFPDSGSNFVINSSTTSIDLCDYGSLTPGMTYWVKVKAVGTGSCFTHTYGDSCQITIPDETRVDNQFCDNHLWFCDEISSYCIAGADEYVFRIINVSSGWDTLEIVSSDPNIFLDDTTIFRAGLRNDSIQVEVRVPPSSSFGSKCGFRFGRGLYASSCSGNRLSSLPSINTAIFPNPFNTHIDISNFSDPLSVQVFSPSGSLVFSDDIMEGLNQVDLSHLTSGIYFIRINTSEKTTVNKIIKE